MGDPVTDSASRAEIGWPDRDQIEQLLGEIAQTAGLLGAVGQAC